MKHKNTPASTPNMENSDLDQKSYIFLAFLPVDGFETILTLVLKQNQNLDPKKLHFPDVFLPVCGFKIILTVVLKHNLDLDNKKLYFH